MVVPPSNQEDLEELNERTFDFSLSTISSDSIPHAALTLYSQVLQGKVTVILLLSSITSIFTLSRNMVDFLFNPFLSFED
jgi:hypothetical protein